MFWDEPAHLLDGAEKHGSYLVSSIYIGPVMMAKMIMTNNQVQHGFGALTQDE